MMQRYILFGLALLLYAPVVNASLPTVANPQYLHPVITRIDDGLARASLGSPSTNLAYVFLSWLEEMKDAFVGSIDTETRIVLEAEDLIHISPCLHHDLLVLEEKIEEINEAIKNAPTSTNIEYIRMLKEVLKYANTRYNHLIKGATDPGYEDVNYYTWQSFDVTGWCCLAPIETTSCVEGDRTTCESLGGVLYGTWQDCSQTCKSPVPVPSPQTPMCPFHSNYLPPVASGYGCDASAMAALSANPSFDEERNALADFEGKRDMFLVEQEGNLHVADTLLTDVGRTVTPTASQRIRANRIHKEVWGCTEQINSVIGEETALPAGAVRTELRGPFSLTKNEIRLVTLTDRLLQERGKAREQENSLKYPYEFEAGSPERLDAEAEEAALPGFAKLIREMLRTYFTEYNTEQAQQEALPLIQSIDVQQRVAEEFEVLREPMMEFGELASKPDKGSRQFVNNMATFLRKSCIYRPCNVLLDTILDMVANDSCFPYTTGAFLGGASFADCGP